MNTDKDMAEGNLIGFKISFGVWFLSQSVSICVNLWLHLFQMFKNWDLVNTTLH